MTSKAALKNILRKGKLILQGAFKTETQKVGVKVALPRKPAPVQNVIQYKSPQPLNRLQYLWQKLLPQKYFLSLASELGRKAAWRSARNVPLLGFVGLVMSQDAKREEDEVIEKLQLFAKNTGVGLDTSPLMEKIHQLSLENFEFGQLIGQGCNSAVYEAHLKDDADTEFLEASLAENEDIDVISETESPNFEDTNNIMNLLSAEIDALNFEEQKDEDFSDTDSDITILSLPDDDIEEMDKPPSEFLVELEGDLISLSDMEEETAESIELMNSLTEKLEEDQQYASLDSNYSVDKTEWYNFAVKMMFNYCVESNAEAIMQEMEKETVPARLAQTHEQMQTWQNGHKVKKKRLPLHPNIVEMLGVFVDHVPDLPDGLQNYPAALPARINEHGIGRNMTMFLVMKRYHATLGEYLSTYNPTIKERLCLLAQVFEAVDHMTKHNIAHRDLKMNNIFIDLCTAGSPQLVVGDFGCCLANEDYGLQIPYPTEDMNKGGNTALMAPEIATAEAGPRSILDYRKTDIWACGALAYEIFGADNPFYTHSNSKRLDSRTFSEEDLPPLPDTVPFVIKQLVHMILNRDPKKRPSARLAADIVQILLWAPSGWLLTGNKISTLEIKWWLLSMATEVLFCAKSTDIHLKRCFLENLNMNRLHHAFSFLMLNDL